MISDFGCKFCLTMFECCITIWFLWIKQWKITGSFGLSKFCCCMFYVSLSLVLIYFCLSLSYYVIPIINLLLLIIFLLWCPYITLDKPYLLNLPNEIVMTLIYAQEITLWKISKGRKISLNRDWIFPSVCSYDYLIVH